MPNSEQVSIISHLPISNWILGWQNIENLQQQLGALVTRLGLQRFDTLDICWWDGCLSRFIDSNDFFAFPAFSFFPFLTSGAATRGKCLVRRNSAIQKITIGKLFESRHLSAIQHSFQAFGIVDLPFLFSTFSTSSTFSVLGFRFLLPGFVEVLRFGSNGCSFDQLELNIFRIPGLLVGAVSVSLPEISRWKFTWRTHVKKLALNDLNKKLNDLSTSPSWRCEIFSGWIELQSVVVEPPLWRIFAKMGFIFCKFRDENSEENSWNYLQWQCHVKRLQIPMFVLTMFEASQCDVFYFSPVIAPTCISQNAVEGTSGSTQHQKTGPQKGRPPKKVSKIIPQKIHKRFCVGRYPGTSILNRLNVINASSCWPLICEKFSWLFVSPPSFPAKIKERCSCCWMVRDVLRLRCFCWARCAKPSASSMQTPIRRKKTSLRYHMKHMKL